MLRRTSVYSSVGEGIKQHDLESLERILQTLFFRGFL